MKCKNCSTDIITTDICGDKCVYCYGVKEPYKETSMTCFWCGKEASVLHNDLCKNCYIIWNELDNEDREKIIIKSWDRKSDTQI